MNTGPYVYAPLNSPATPITNAQSKRGKSKRKKRGGSFLLIVLVTLSSYSVRNSHFFKEDTPVQPPSPILMTPLPSLLPGLGDTHLPGLSDMQGNESGDSSDSQNYYRYLDLSGATIDTSLAPSGSTVVGPWAVAILETEADATDTVYTVDKTAADIIGDSAKFLGLKLRLTNLASMKLIATEGLEVNVVDADGEMAKNFLVPELNSLDYSSHFLQQGESIEGWVYIPVLPNFLTSTVGLQFHSASGTEYATIDHPIP